MLSDPHLSSDDAVAEAVGDSPLQDQGLHLQVKRTLGGQRVYFVGGGLVPRGLDADGRRRVEDEERAAPFHTRRVQAVRGDHPGARQGFPLVSQDRQMVRLRLDHSPHHHEAADQCDQEHRDGENLEQVAQEPGSTHPVAGAVTPSAIEDFEPAVGTGQHGSLDCG